MTRLLIRPTALLLAASAVLLAQTPVDPQSTPPANGGWRRVGDAQQAAPAPQAQPPAMERQAPAEPAARDAFGQAQQPAVRPPAAQPVRPSYGLPPQVTVKPGTFVTVRVNEKLASNRNQPGDTFSATLVQPIVVDGVVVAQRNQTVYGRVAQAEKVKGVSHLGIELTNVTLADGSQVTVHSQLVSRQGGTTPGGEQVGTIATTTLVGAMVGSAADYRGGTGAGVGAGVGAAAGIIGVLVTRNRPSVIYPETALTFQLQSAITVNTGNSPAAFRYVGPEDYERPAEVVRRPPERRTTYIFGGGYYDPFYYPYYGGYRWGGPRFVIGGGLHFGGYRRWR